MFCLVDPPIIRQAFPEETLHPGPSVFLKCVAGGKKMFQIDFAQYRLKA